MQLISKEKTGKLFYSGITEDSEILVLVITFLFIYFPSSLCFRRHSQFIYFCLKRVYYHVKFSYRELKRLSYCWLEI
jgi:hypothetical protein